MDSNTIDIGNAKFLYEEGNNYFIRDEKGQIGKIPKNKFYNGQIVQTTNSYFSPKKFTRLINPHWVASRNIWVYGENYIDLQGGGGGCGFSFEENNFLELSAPDSILYAERIYLKTKIEYLDQQRKIAADKLVKIEYALSISVKDWNSVMSKCLDCGNTFTRNKANANIDKCDNCYPKQ